ncbi:zf-HC2 domain-containing protein [Streptomyces sp. BP-8]|uniref:Zf-HC2 domain-containing protein n=1 Tax=Streptomyces sirii TaxID=3127701 RepID=A0ABZ2QQJ3_9ACTN
MSARYADGSLPESATWSLERHLEACTPCATTVSRAVGATGVATAVLAEIRGSVLLAIAEAEAHEAAGAAHHPSPSPNRRLGRALWAAGPALRGPWVVALLLVCAAAAGLAYGAGFDGARPLLLAFAPVLPLAGVALSYGPHADPMYEISATTPSGGLRLLLTRTAAVLGVSLPLLTAVGAFLPGPPGIPGAAAWLLPALALVLGALALGSYVGCRTATGIVAAGWTFAVLLPVFSVSGDGGGDSGGDGRTLPVTALAEQLAQYLSGVSVQGGWAVAAALCAGVLALRRHSFDFSPGSGRGLRFDRLENP